MLSSKETVEEALVGTVLIGGVGSSRGLRASPSLLDAGARLPSFCKRGR